MNTTSSRLSFQNRDREEFPCITTTILNVHTDEVWNVAWNHDGSRLASASRDKTAIIWRIINIESSACECVVEFTLREHPFPVGALAWSLDDSILVTSADQLIFLWDTKTGKCLRTLDCHSETVSAFVWLPDGTGFMSAGLDRKIFSWDMAGKLRDDWASVPVRVTDMAITPDLTRLVTVGVGYSTVQLTAEYESPGVSRASTPSLTGNENSITTNAFGQLENRIIIYDLKSRAIELSLPTDGDPTSVKISEDSRFVLTNHAQDEVHLWDLKEGRLARKFTGQQQRHHIIRSCFGGVNGNFVVSGSEDRHVYVWRRDNGVLLGTLSGHGAGTVNSVAWNPRNKHMFASCSDDSTIRLWVPLS